MGVLVLVLTLWQDANYTGPHDDVAAGMAGLAMTLGGGVFVLMTGMGVAFGAMASRRAPERRSADVALGLNVITLVGALLSVVVLVLL